MKKLMILSVVAIAISMSYAYAQQGRKGRSNMEPKEMAEWQTNQMKANLNLTVDQLPKVEALNLKYAEKMKAEKDKVQGDRDTRRNAMLAMRNEKDQELKKVLTEEQWKKLDAWRKDAQSKRGKGQGRHQRGGSGRGI